MDIAILLVLCVVVILYFITQKSKKEKDLELPKTPNPEPSNKRQKQDYPKNPTKASNSEPSYRGINIDTTSLGSEEKTQKNSSSKNGNNYSKHDDKISKRTNCITAKNPRRNMPSGRGYA